METEIQQGDKAAAGEAKSEKPPEEGFKTASEETEVQPKPVFKIPMLIGPRPQKLKQLKAACVDAASLSEDKTEAAIVPDPDASSESVQSSPRTSEQQKSTANSVGKTSKSPAEALQSISTAIPYKEPPWGGLPPKPYSFEVLKRGAIRESIGLSSRSFTVFGRLSSCDVKMEHPTISRYHAVAQYRASESADSPAGFYLYDLDSTHGTLLNKSRVKPRSYYRLRVGHMVRLGCSTRSFILQGPDEDAEEESPLTVTEIKEKARQDEETRRQEAERLKLLKEEADAKREKEDEDQGIDWGMGDDAAEEDGYGDNPYALDTPALNEELYINDPKKTLRGWFEREGYDLEYNVEEKGQAHFLCRVQLPLDSPSGAPMYAEASVKGKKKEAVIACALEACRLLDRHGVLRQANHEGRHRKRKNWEDEDFYDSDEDTYLDQTGTIEKKRLQRIQRAGKEGSGVETYESLTQKHNQILLEIRKTEEMLQKSSKQESNEDLEDLDSLDAYMMSIKSNKGSLDKKAKTGLKIQLSQLKQEEQKLRKLVNIAKPASLPVYPKPEIQSPKLMQSATPPKEQPKIITSTEMETKAISPSTPVPKVLTKCEAPEEKNTKVCSPSKKTEDPSVKTVHGCSPSIKIEDPSIKTEDQRLVDCVDDSASAVQKTQDEEDTGSEAIISDDASDQQPAVPKRKSAHDSKRNKRSKQKLKYDYNSSDPNYAMWLPPEDQSGDGRTNLNEKFGY